MATVLRKDGECAVTETKRDWYLESFGVETKNYSINLVTGSHERVDSACSHQGNQLH